ncbi:MAG: cobalamin-binding protein [Candidatus Aenigmarchaeota archaeon]|nr:cobalamin-binding protein [Candidatus Aenigmarchaeota archaeon]
MPCERIISLAPSNTEILYALGLENKIAGVTRYCDYPPAAKEKPNVGGWLDINFEMIKDLKPDLILTSTFVQNKVKENLEKEGYDVFHVDPVTMEDVLESIISAGEKLDAENNASALVEKMRSEITAVKERAKRFINKPKIYAEEWHKPPTVCGNWIPDMLEIAGASGLCEKGIHSRAVSNDEVINFSPDIIIVSWCGFGEKAKLEWIKQRKGWEEIKAVKESSLHVADDSLLNRPGPRLVEGLKMFENIVRDWNENQKNKED